MPMKWKRGLLKQNRPSLLGKLLCRPSCRSRAISMEYLQEDPCISHNHTCVKFRNAIKKSTLDHLLCVIHWDRQQDMEMKKTPFLHSCGIHRHLTMLFQHSPEALLSTIRQIDLNPWNQPLVPVWSCFLPLERPSKYQEMEDHELSWALLPLFTHPQISLTGLLFPKHTSYSPMSNLQRQEDLYFPNTISTHPWPPT